MNFDISAMKLRAKSLVKQCGNTPALIEALLWLLRVIAVMCGSLSTQNGSIGGYSKGQTGNVVYKSYG